MIFEQSIGVNVRDIIVEKNCSNYCYCKLFKKFSSITIQKTIGIKILIKTIDVEIIANITSFDPDKDASSLEDPDSIFL